MRAEVILSAFKAGFCGPVDRSKSPFDRLRVISRSTWIDVPALLCEQCQEPLFTEDVVRLVQQMIRTLDARRKELGAITLAA